LLAFLDVGGFNTLIGDAAAWAADSLHAAPWERDAIRAAWRQTVDQLETTSFDWIPAITLREFRVPVATPARGVRGDTLAARGARRSCAGKRGDSIRSWRSRCVPRASPAIGGGWASPPGSPSPGRPWCC